VGDLPWQDVQRLLEDHPLFHKDGSDLTSWQSQAEVLQFLCGALTPGMTSLETGCGYSTCVFALSGANHTSVTPYSDEAARVTNYCVRNGINVDKVTFAIGKSQDVLPMLSKEAPLDLVYIDGAHGFLFPCVDWTYTECRLRVGGLMLVDDVRIPTVRIVHDFMIAEENWSLVEYIGDTAIFQKTAEPDLSSDFLTQAYNRGYPDFSFKKSSQDTSGC
jgi:predicted O-methyltransferase YrrM